MALPRQLYRLALSPEIAVGIIFFTLSCLLWIKVLTRADLSRAYPMVSLGYINITICSYFFFHEAFTFTKLLGTVFIYYRGCSD
jgi:multidrug transporter EmrE-like cation transporter